MLFAAVEAALAKQAGGAIGKEAGAVIAALSVDGHKALLAVVAAIVSPFYPSSVALAGGAPPADDVIAKWAVGRATAIITAASAAVPPPKA
jgi:hypothetical protein